MSYANFRQAQAAYDNQCPDESPAYIGAYLDRVESDLRSIGLSTSAKRALRLHHLLDVSIEVDDHHGGGAEIAWVSCRLPNGRRVDLSAYDGDIESQVDRARREVDQYDEVLTSMLSGDRHDAQQAELLANFIRSIAYAVRFRVDALQSHYADNAITSVY